MLTIPRRKGESIVIGDEMILTVVEIQGDQVRFELDCPAETRVRRQRAGESADDLPITLTHRPVPTRGPRRPL